MKITNIINAQKCAKYKIIQRLLLNVILLLSSVACYAQNSSNADNRLFVKMCIGVGVGSGYPYQTALGIAALGEISFQKLHHFINIGTRDVSEFVFLFAPNVINSSSTAELGYGKLIEKHKASFLISTGISTVTFRQRGAAIPNNNGFQIFGSSNYELIKYQAVGVPFSAKLFFSNKKKRGLLVEFFGNINKQIPFIGVNIANQFIVFKTEAKK